MSTAGRSRHGWGITGLVGSLIVIAGLAAAAPQGPLEKFYGNTLESRHEDGKVFRVYLDRDLNYHVLDQQGNTIRQGTYTFTDNKLCFFDQGKAGECPPFRADLEIGKTWDGLTSTGHHVYLTLRPGR
jgi:hypothetical protein